MPEPLSFPTKLYKQIIGDLFIPYSEGTAWIKRRYNVNLAENHSTDLTILARLVQILDANHYSCDVTIVQGQDPMELNILFPTQQIRGDFLNIGPPGEEVIQDNLKDVLKPGQQEERIRQVLLDMFG